MLNIPERLCGDAVVTVAVLPERVMPATATGVQIQVFVGMIYPPSPGYPQAQSRVHQHETPTALTARTA